MEIIYGGIWWGRLNEISIYVPGRPKQMWRAAYAMWIIGFPVPVAGPWLVACFLASWTTSSGCKVMEGEILKAMEPDQPRAGSVKEWLGVCEAEWGSYDGCFDKLCRDEPHFVMVTAVILGVIGAPAAFILLKGLWEKVTGKAKPRRQNVDDTLI